MTINYINLTPHDVNLFPLTEDGAPIGDPIIIAPDGPPARISLKPHGPYLFDPAFVKVAMMQDVINLPDPDRTPMDTIYIVSLATAAAALSRHPYRRDVAVPGEPVKDEHGKIVGCIGLTIVLSATRL